MAPKPFPFPLGVGVDVCKISRIAALLRQEGLRNRWARRVFTRLEWTAVCRRFQRANRLEGEPSRNGEKEMQDITGSDGKPKDDIWALPKLSKHFPTLENEDQSAYWSTIADERSRLGSLARYLAGRWAAKEAVIKAHRHRHLYMQDISIVKQPKLDKVIALIDPVCTTIGMHERVATLRSLRGFGPRSQGLHKGPLASEAEDELVQQGTRSVHFNRRRRIEETERQVAEINISHDGEYAVAVCMAFDAPGLQPEGRHIVDNGTGPMMHEPQWGDEGWFDPDNVAKDDEGTDKSIDDLLEGAETPRDSEDPWKALKDAFETAEEWKIPPLP